MHVLGHSQRAGVPVHVSFYLQPYQQHKLWFPGIQTGTTWSVDVRCEKGQDSGVQFVS
ncbi:hypothetical protein [Mycobacterium hubeiense]|uniref:hypothetical protein n=1 Tax=Mycobacterium hubeiense TaxID=1867256 RepID=UPI00130472AE|nr:hypothetical protein [Mycobacterium sp. QGD 101]